MIHVGQMAYTAPQVSYSASVELRDGHTCPFFIAQQEGVWDVHSTRENEDDCEQEAFAAQKTYKTLGNQIMSWVFAAGFIFTS